MVAYPVCMRRSGPGENLGSLAAWTSSIAALEEFRLGSGDRPAGTTEGGPGEGLGLLFEISNVGSSHSSPPVPMISGYVSTNRTINPFRLFLVCGGGRRARSCLELERPSTSEAFGYRRALPMSSLVSAGGPAWATWSVSDGPRRKSFRFSWLGASPCETLRSRSRPNSFPMIRPRFEPLPSSWTLTFGTSFSILPVDRWARMLQKRASWSLGGRVREGGIRIRGERGNSACASVPWSTRRGLTTATGTRPRRSVGEAWVVVPQGLHPASTRQQGQGIGNRGSSWCEGIEKKQRRGWRWVGVVVVGVPYEGGCGPGRWLGEVDWTLGSGRPLRQ